MFNLLVTANENAWNGPAEKFHVTRVLKSYTDDHLKAKFGALDDASVEALCRMPAVFAYEKGIGQAPKFGQVTGVRHRSTRLEVAVDYTLIDLPRFLSEQEL